MPRIAIADLFVGGILNMAIAIARFHVQHALHAVKHGLRAPEAPTTQGDHWVIAEVVVKGL